IRISSFFFSSRRRHTRFSRDWSSDVCSSDLRGQPHVALNLHNVSLHLLHLHIYHVIFSECFFPHDYHLLQVISSHSHLFAKILSIRGCKFLSAFALWLMLFFCSELSSAIVCCKEGT